MDIFHHLFLLTRRDRLHQAPVVEKADGSTRILDLGTGTGIWAIDMAESVHAGHRAAWKMILIADATANTNALKWVTGLPRAIDRHSRRSRVIPRSSAQTLSTYNHRSESFPCATKNDLQG